jgi:hypothetical protein
MEQGIFEGREVWISRIFIQGEKYGYVGETMVRYDYQTRIWYRASSR